jgi:hypothetical protein
MNLRNMLVICVFFQKETIEKKGFDVIFEFFDSSILKLEMKRK